MWFVRLCPFNPSRRLLQKEEEEEEEVKEEAKCSEDLVRTRTSAHQRWQFCPRRKHSLRKVQYTDRHTSIRSEAAALARTYRFKTRLPMTKERLTSEARHGDAVKLKVERWNLWRFDPQRSNTIVVIVYKRNSFHVSVPISFSPWKIPGKKKKKTSIDFNFAVNLEYIQVMISALNSRFFSSLPLKADQSKCVFWNNNRFCICIFF